MKKTFLNLSEWLITG